MLLDEGLEAAFARHAALGRACREGVKAMGLELFSPDEERSAVVTAILTPDGVDAKELVLELRDRFGITVAGAHGELGTRMFRIGHIGYYDVLRHHDRAHRGRDAPRGARSGDRAGRRRGARARGVPRHRACLSDPASSSASRSPSRASSSCGSASRSSRTRSRDLGSIIGDYDAIVIRSATTLDAALIERADRLKVIGRAGVGVDNVDVDAATRRGIVVANAAESTVDSAAEHAIALLFALARNIPQAHAALTAGTWDRERLTGIELAGKTLGVLGLGRIGRQVAHRALGLGMRVVAYDPFVAADRFRELGVEPAASLDEVYALADVITLHLPLTDETRGLARGVCVRADEATACGS